jgi:hypothetical protein
MTIQATIKITNLPAGSISEMSSNGRGQNFFHIITGSVERKLEVLGEFGQGRYINLDWKANEYWLLPWVAQQGIPVEFG